MLTPKRRPKSPFWILRGTIDGKRVEVSRKWTSQAEARRAIPSVIAEYSADPVQKSAVTFGEALDAYRKAKPSARFLDKIEAHFGEMLLSEITASTLREASEELYPGRSPATVKRNLYTPVKAILNMAADEELCAPPRLKSPKGGNKRTYFLLPKTANEIISFLAGSENGYLAPLVTFLLGQGSRMGETIDLDGTDVHLDHKLAILRNTKNGDERAVTLVPKVVAALSRLPTIGKTGPVFRRTDGLPFSSRTNRGGQIKDPFALAVKSVGLDTAIYTPHVCRHSWATWFYAQTKDVLRLQAEGGWKSAEWQRYTKITAPTIGDEAMKAGWDFAAAGENRGNIARPHVISGG